MTAQTLALYSTIDLDRDVLEPPAPLSRGRGDGGEGWIHGFKHRIWY
jgi:hypothetical protein